MIDVLRRAGAQVTVASVESTLEVTCSRGVKLVADQLMAGAPLPPAPATWPSQGRARHRPWLGCSPLCLGHTTFTLHPSAWAPLLHGVMRAPAPADAAGSSYDLVACPGGMPGAERLRDSAELAALVASQKAAGKKYAAICATPAVFFEAQVGGRPLRRWASVVVTRALLLLLLLLPARTRTHTATCPANGPAGAAGWQVRHRPPRLLRQAEQPGGSGAARGGGWGADHQPGAGDGV